LVCLILVVMGWIVIDLQNRAERSFRSCQPGLPLTQRISLSIACCSQKIFDRPARSGRRSQEFKVELGESPSTSPTACKACA